MSSHIAKCCLVSWPRESSEAGLEVHVLGVEAQMVEGFWAGGQEMKEQFAKTVAETEKANIYSMRGLHSKLCLNV